MGAETDSADGEQEVTHHGRRIGQATERSREPSTVDPQGPTQPARPPEARPSQPLTQTTRRRRRNRKAGAPSPTQPGIAERRAGPAAPSDVPSRRPATELVPTDPIVTDQSRRLPAQRRNDPARGQDRRHAPGRLPRGTMGTLPTDAGAGRGLSGSPRTTNHHGEVPIRPDNRTFDGTHDRMVCVARSHIVPEDFPVQHRRMTAAGRLSVVARDGTNLLYCDLAHTGPHVWPDLTEVRVTSLGRASRRVSSDTRAPD